jgi:ligand-binding sensor domain-containing protein/serine phosphatase RsbU (regulator of sigma subunit)
MNRIVLLLFSFLSLVPLVHAQKEDIQFEHLSMKDGLSMNPVMAITQDKNGFLWFGTQDGLNKFDGYRFSVFKTNERDSGSISDNFITSLSLDRDSNLWVGTLSGLNVYNYSQNNFSKLNKPNKYFQSLKIFCSYIDKEGLLWVGTSNGLSLLDPRSKQFIDVKSKFSGLNTMSQKSVLSIFQDSHGNYWFGTSSGLVKYDPAAKNMQNFYYKGDQKSLSNNVILCFYEDKNRELWIGTLNGLNKFHPETETFSHTFFKEEKDILTSTKKNNAISGSNIYSIVNNYGGNTIRCILEDEKGLFWIGTDMELVIYNPKDGSFINYKKDLINPTGINDHFIRSMYVDRSKNLWIGTLGNGLNKTNLKPKKFQHWQKKINNPFSLSENYVRSICEDESGNLWVGTLVGGLNRFEKSSGKFFHYKKTAFLSPNSINDDNTWSVCYDKKRKGLWVGTNNGLDFLDLATNKFTHYVHQENDPASISDNTIRYVYLDRKGQVWCGTENGLNLFLENTGTFRSFTPSNSNISDHTVWCIREDKKGKLWLATNDGLNQFDPLLNTFTVYKRKPGDLKSLSHNGVRTLCLDKDGYLWVGTQNGLNRFDFLTREFQRFNEAEGLPNPFIYAIVQDNDGLIWLSTNKGISAFDPQNESFKNYDIYDGLQDYEFNTNACFKSKNGDIYFGGPNGFNVFNPQKIPVNNFYPPIKITDIKVKDEPVALSKIKNDVLTLDYCEDIVFLEFSALDYTSPQRNHYMYKLEGFNEKWVDAGNVRFCTYTNLNPGNYTFLVSGSNVDGVWNPAITKLNIIINPPFWKTIWFYCLCGALLIVAVLFFIHWRTKSLIRAKVHLENTVKERTAVVELQKSELTQKNKDITDSINYAKRIQTAVLPEEQHISKWFSDAFVLYAPRDIVSGDMYWHAEVTTSTSQQLKLKVVAVVDCTGHGVPGAFMSLIVSQMLNQTIKDPSVNSPADVLSFLTRRLPQALSKNSEKISDGLDIAVCAIDLTNSKLYYSGANRPLWMIKNGKQELEEIKPTKSAIGGYFQDFTVFQNHSVPIEKGDKFYLFSDGYVDQFGGPKGKKIGSSNFKKLILQTSKTSMSQQKTELKNFMDDWRKDKEQIDDICVMGIQI